jgi:hypothetical protein
MCTLCTIGLMNICKPLFLLCKFLHILHLCMIEIMKIQSSNKYKIPHVNKEKLERKGLLLIQTKCDPMLVQDVSDYLNIK